VRLLLDHCIDWRLGRSLRGHEFRTTRELGWNHLTNGKLLAEAAKAFDAFMTVDRDIGHQQNAATLPIPVVVLVARTNRLADLVPLVPSLKEALKRLQAHAIVEVSLSAP
jgi:predicted nuclease of predicted toxin-antitoxin system